MSPRATTKIGTRCRWKLPFGVSWHFRARQRPSVKMAPTWKKIKAERWWPWLKWDRDRAQSWCPPATGPLDVLNCLPAPWADTVRQANEPYSHQLWAPLGCLPLTGPFRAISQLLQSHGAQGHVFHCFSKLHVVEVHLSVAGLKN